MTQPFQTQQQIKTRISVLVFLKGNAAPLVLYVENPNELYDELISYLKTPAVNKIVEKETIGPIKKVVFNISQMSAVAIQEEQYIQQ